MVSGFDKTCESFMRYLNVDSEEEQYFGMACTNAGHTKIKPNTIYPPNIDKHPAQFRSVADGRVLEEFQIGYITQGEGIFETETVSHKITPGSMILVLPGVRHRCRPVTDTGWHEYWVGFRGNYFSRLVDEGVLSEHFVSYEDSLSGEIVSIYRQIFGEVVIQKTMYQLKSCSGILQLIAELLVHKNRQRNEPDINRQLVERAKGFIELECDKGMDMSGISGELGISVSYFNRIFKTHTSMTPYQYYIDTKISAAKNLLEKDEATVKETAYQLGFEDQYYFSRLFKSKTGVAPKNWKKHSAGFM